jgi:hypothetical protein
MTRDQSFVSVGGTQRDLFPAPAGIAVVDGLTFSFSGVWS